MKPCFQIIEIRPDSIILLNRTQGLWKEVTEGTNKREWDIQMTKNCFLGFSILLSISYGETVGKEGEGVPFCN